MEKDLVEGLKWLQLAAAQGQPDAPHKLAEAETSASATQIAEARSRAAAFVPRQSAP
jgi:TPR repeat protein